MDLYLQALLRGDVDSEQALQWAACNVETPAPEVQLVFGPSDAGPSPSVWHRPPPRAFTSAQFRAHLLDFVRQQSDGLLAAGATLPACKPLASQFSLDAAAYF